MSLWQQLTTDHGAPARVPGAAASEQGLSGGRAREWRGVCIDLATANSDRRLVTGIKRWGDGVRNVFCRNGNEGYGAKWLGKVGER